MLVQRAKRLQKEEATEVVSSNEWGIEVEEESQPQKSSEVAASN